MLDSVGVGKSPYGIVVKVVHPPGAGGMLSLLSVWRCLLPIIVFVKVIVVSRHSERSGESNVDAESSNLGKSILLISRYLTLYLERSFDKLKMTSPRHSERSAEFHAYAERSNLGKSTMLISSSLALYFRRSFGKFNMMRPVILSAAKNLMGM